MAEEVKKAPRPVDPNSAKYKLGKIAGDAYANAIEAKKAGKPVAWVSSNFPVEIPETLGLYTVYPENQAAGIAARGAGERMCNVAEADGYSNDICAYARISLAYAKLKECPEQDVAMPDVLLCCNNICNCMIKWYENVALDLNIPLIMIDIPFNHFYKATPEQIAYVGQQFRDAIAQLEDITGKKWNEERFGEVCACTNATSKAMLRVADYLQYEPSPLAGFDLFNHMGVLITALGAPDSAAAFNQLADEYEALIKAGRSTFRGEREDYRIMFEGIACWPHLKFTSKSLIAKNINVAATIYAVAATHVYNTFDEMIASYYTIPGAMNLELSRDRRVQLCKANHVQGMLVHTNRSCKNWSGIMPEMSRQIGEICHIPVVAFDGDQADPRNFSEAQYETRVQGLMEIMQENKAGEQHV